MARKKRYGEMAIEKHADRRQSTRASVSLCHGIKRGTETESIFRTFQLTGFGKTVVIGQREHDDRIGLCRVMITSA